MSNTQMALRRQSGTALVLLVLAIMVTINAFRSSDRWSATDHREYAADQALRDDAQDTEIAIAKTRADDARAAVQSLWELLGMGP